MTLDCFTFFNEFDLLEIRLRLLDAHVDRFVLVESDRAYSGQPKRLLFQENRSRFAPWLHKITCLNPPAADYAEDWMRANPGRAFDGTGFEAMHRDHLRTLHPDLADEDIVIQSDVDEVPDPLAFERCREMLARGDECLKMIQRNHYYFLNCCREKWGGSILMTGAFFKRYRPQSIRVDETVRKVDCPEGGWHWSFLGGVEAIREKLRSYTHYDLFRPPYNDPEYIGRCLAEGKDLFGHGDWVPYSMDEYRPDVRAVLRDYPHLIHENSPA